MFNSFSFFGSWQSEQYSIFKRFFYQRKTFLFYNRRLFKKQTNKTKSFVLSTPTRGVAVGKIVRFFFKNFFYFYWKSTWFLPINRSFIFYKNAFCISWKEKINYTSILKSFIKQRPLFVYMRVMTSKTFVGGRKTKNIDLCFFFKKNTLGPFKCFLGSGKTKTFLKNYQFFYRWVFSNRFYIKMWLKKKRLTDFIFKLGEARTNLVD